MRKMLAILLAVLFLTLAPSPRLSINRPSLAASTKFYTAANPIPGRYIVVLATTDLSPIAAPAPTPVSSRSTQFAAAMAISPDSSSSAVATEPAPDPVVVATATDLTAAYGGTFSDTWSNALKGFRLNSTDPQAIAMSGDSRVAFIVQDG